MTHHRSLVLGVLLAAHTLLSACDSTARLTEQEHIQRAKDFEDKGDLNASIVELKNAVQKNPDSPEARLLLGQIYLKREMGAEAEKELSKAAKLGVVRELITPQLGEALLLMGEHARVLEEIQPTTQTSPANRARIVQIRADALRGRGYHNEACKLYQESLALDRQNPGTYWGLAQCAIADKDLPAARKWLDAALKLPEKQTKTWIRVASSRKRFRALWQRTTSRPRSDSRRRSTPRHATPSRKA
jgi:tetratricopeptide (TPR) repeat protein